MSKFLFKIDFLWEKSMADDNDLDLNDDTGGSVDDLGGSWSGS